jgi:hypothetical protein
LLNPQKNIFSDFDQNSFSYQAWTLAVKEGDLENK